MKWLTAIIVAFVFDLYGQTGSIAKLYEDGKKDFLAGNYKSAREKFQRLLLMTRTHHLSDNAQFWIAETYMVEAAYADSIGDTTSAREKYELAIKSFREVFKFKDSKTPKYADALYEISNILFRRGNYKQAYKEAVNLVAFYPDHPISPKARALIGKIKEKERQVGKTSEPSSSYDTISAPRDSASGDSAK